MNNNNLFSNSHRESPFQIKDDHFFLVKFAIDIGFDVFFLQRYWQTQVKFISRFIRLRRAHTCTPARGNCAI